MPEVIHKEGTHKKARASRADQSAADVNKQWQDVTDQLAAARIRLAQCEQAVGEAVADGLDHTAKAQEVQAAESEVRQLESAVAILWQRREDEIEARRQQALAVSREQEQGDLTTLYEMACDICAWMESGKAPFARYAEQRKKVLAHGNQAVNAQLHDANLSFTSFLFRVCGCMAACTNSYASFQTDEKWKRPWSQMHPQPELVDQPRIEPPTEKPIPGWQIGE